MGIHEGDIITVVGPKTSFNKEPQMKNVSVESFKTVKDLTIKDFVAKGRTTVFPVRFLELSMAMFIETSILLMRPERYMYMAS